MSFQKIALTTLLLSGISIGAHAQLADAITPDPGVEPEWITLGTVSFAAIDEKTIQVSEWRARDLDMIAFQPLGDNLECRNMTVTLADGNTQDLPVELEGRLKQHTIYKLALSGDDVNVTAVDLACRSADGNISVVQVYGIPDGLGEGSRTPY